MSRSKKEVMRLAKGGHWIQKAIKNPGALHRTLRVPEHKTIPATKLTEATHAHNPLTRKRALLAQTLSKISRRRK